MRECDTPDPEWFIETADPDYIATLTADQYDADDVREWQNTDDGYILFDTEKLAAEMDLNRGDVFTMDGSAFQVKSIDTRFSASDRDSLTVTDPTATNPIDARYGDWGIPLLNVFEAWKRGNAEPRDVKSLAGSSYSASSSVLGR